MTVQPTVRIAGQCGHCGMLHSNPATCPRIKAIEYHENGTIKRVEYHAAPSAPVVAASSGGSGT